jgi:hypothetical protein
MTTPDMPQALTPWVFGVDPVAGQRRFTELTRQLASLVVTVENDSAELDELNDMLQAACERMQSLVPSSPAARVGACTEGRVYIDHGRGIGDYNPMFPAYTVTEVSEERARGTVNFPLCYEGPPNSCHGGFLTVFVDCVVQHHNCQIGLSGKTRGINIRFRRLVPLLTDLDFEIERTVEESSVTSVVRLTLDGELLCEATTPAVAADRTKLPPWSPREPAGE